MRLPRAVSRYAKYLTAGASVAYWRALTSARALGRLFGMLRLLWTILPLICLGSIAFVVGVARPLATFGSVYLTVCLINSLPLPFMSSHCC
jgi:hypothetical protein